MIKKINWEDYENTFPERYIKVSDFDTVVRNKIEEISKKEKRKIDILEIGSNKTIRYNFIDFVNNYFVFDKYVTIKNKDVIVLPSENDLQKQDYDLIILRNCFNYLDSNEIIKLSLLVKSNNCELVFNTFSNPTEMNRPYTSKNAVGLESSKYDVKHKQIVHTLRPKDSNDEITHLFYYYSTEAIIIFFQGLNTTFSNIRNTLYVQVKP